MVKTSLRMIQLVKNHIFHERGDKDCKVTENEMVRPWNNLHKMIVLLVVTTAVMKHHDQKQLREERIYLAYSSTSLFITEGSQDRNSHRSGTWRQELMQRP